MMRVLLIATTIALGGSARAEVDWAKGLVTAEGIGVASRSAPTPAAARGPARRLAEESARKQLAAHVGAVPVADGGTVAQHVKKDAAVKAAVEKAVAHAIVVASELETDGSWRVTMGVPIEALRQAIVGSVRALGSDDGPPVVVVEGAGIKPAIGVKVGGLSAATVFVKDSAALPAWAKDAPRVKAKDAKGGAAKGRQATIDAPTGGGSESTLFVVVVGK